MRRRSLWLRERLRPWLVAAGRWLMESIYVRRVSESLAMASLSSGMDELGGSWLKRETYVHRASERCRLWRCTCVWTMDAVRATMGCGVRGRPSSTGAGPQAGSGEDRPCKRKVGRQQGQGRMHACISAASMLFLVMLGKHAFIPVSLRLWM